jgi:hypothetical protein
MASYSSQWWSILGSEKCSLAKCTNLVREMTWWKHPTYIIRACFHLQILVPLVCLCSLSKLRSSFGGNRTLDSRAPDPCRHWVAPMAVLQY